MVRRALVRLALAALCAATATPAGIIKKAYEVGLYGGIESGDNNENISSDSAFGLRVGYALTPKLMAELNVDAFDTRREVTGLAGDASQPANQVPFSQPAGASFLGYSIALTANFLTEKDANTKPYLSVGLGFITEERDGAVFCVDTDTGPKDLNGNQITSCADVTPDGRVLDPNRPRLNPGEIFWVTTLDEKDTGSLLTFAVGARTFFSDRFGIRYEGRYYHHEAFNANQDAFELTAGATFVLGGKK